ncbi:MAG: hypothetical protein JOY82_06665 [Streptosporangiaceae bacterium]|nr:hypothetical protein [Streptosporangiaceae bacterium]MBV9854194.1 hypothetical protein [Streptosporangiaceae bacterium]
MAEITLVIGAAAHWDESSSGEVISLAVDPAAWQVTHLVVEPEHRQGLARLVPAHLVEQADGETDEIRLGCTEAEFEALDPAEETLAEFEPAVLLPSSGSWAAPGGFPVEDGMTSWPGEPVEPVDLVPTALPGEEEERRGDQVYATDGGVGHLQALRIDQETGKVTGVCLKRHLWGRKEVTVPIDKVSGFRGGIHLSIPKDEVQHLAT